MYRGRHLLCSDICKCDVDTDNCDNALEMLTIQKGQKKHSLQLTCLLYNVLNEVLCNHCIVMATIRHTCVTLHCIPSQIHYRQTVAY